MNKKLIYIASGVVGLGLIVLLAFSIANEPVIDESIGYGDVTVAGNPLPFLADASAGDPTLGFTAPDVSGADWNDVPVSIEADGRPKIVIFLAHWCSHCQAEVPVVVNWLENGGLPADVDMYGITVLTDKLRPNWPPQDWLESEGWTLPTVMDDEAGTAVQAYGMRGTPFYVVLDGEGTNLGRFSGEIGLNGLQTLVAIAQNSVGSS